MSKFKVGDKVKLCDFSCQEIFNCYEGKVKEGIVIQLGKKKGYCPAHGTVWYDIKIKIGKKKGWTLSQYLKKLR